MGKREDGVNPSQPRYCNGYSQGMMATRIIRGRRFEGYEAEARKPAGVQSFLSCRQRGLAGRLYLRLWQRKQP